MRPYLLVLVLGLSACRCEKITEVKPDVVAAPATLDFGKVALGVSLPLPVEVSNLGLATAELAVTLDGPFTLAAATPSELAGATTLELTVTFTPTALGPASGTLALGPGLPLVALTGEGLPACVASEVCRTVHFDLATRACVEEALPEATPCSAPCLDAAGTCRGGLCLGNAVRCVDGDACTLDACTTDGGCLHPPRECPVTDPCQSTFCDRVTGCGAQAVDDGVPCGEAVCEGAKICLAGRCEFRMRPNALLDCRYTSLSSAMSSTCAVTAGHELRCWGSNGVDQLGRGFPQTAAPPGRAVGLSGVRSVAAVEHTTWVARSSGDVVQTNGTAVLSLDVAGLAAGEGLVCGIELGTAKCARADAGAFELARDVIALSSSGDSFGIPYETCVVSTDGGVSCGVPGALAHVPTPGPASSVSSAGAGSGCALLGDRGYCWGALADGGWDGGVTVVAATGVWLEVFGPSACAARETELECRGNPWLETRWSAPAPITAISLGFVHGCVLLADGNIHCWGTNHSGELGDRSVQPLGVQRRSEPVTWLGAVDWRVLSESAGSVIDLEWGQVVPNDAGRTEIAASFRELPGARAGYEHGCRCVAVDGGTWCHDVGPLPVGLTSACAKDYRSGDICIGGADGTVRCWAQGDAGAELKSAWDAGAGVRSLSLSSLLFGGGSSLCALRDDGEVRCHGTWMNPVPESLTQVAELCAGDAIGGGCARLASGALRCWRYGSPAPAAPPGSWPVVRSVTCGARHACWLSGVNIVQCWGDNEYGQLGLDGPPSMRAVTVPMSEPVVAIAAGSFHTCAQLQSGRLACWGQNVNAQLGATTLIQTRLPRLVRE